MLPRITISVLLSLAMTVSFAQGDLSGWPYPPEKNYPEKGTKDHQVDYVFLDVADWEKYCDGTTYQTNTEIPARITYYASDNEKIFTSTIGIRLSGIFIRKLPQKSIAVDFSTKKYNSDRVNYEMFPTRDYDRVNSFVIRAHGNPLGLTFFKDAMMNEIVDEWTDLEYSAYRPVVLYINGQYHGLYNLREKKNKDFLSNLYDLSKGDIECFDVMGGTPSEPNADYIDLMTYAEKNDLSKPEHYAWMSERMEIDNFIDYNIAHVFFCNTDWPKANVKVWRPAGGKWRWMFFDCDRGFIPGNVNFNLLEHITGADQWEAKRRDGKVDDRLTKSSIIIRKMMLNKEFAQKFAMRYQDLLNTCFTEERVNWYIAECQSRIQPEVRAHIDYWKDIKNDASYQFVKTYEEWQKNVADMYKFSAQRPVMEVATIEKKFNFSGHKTIPFTIADTTMGYLKINTVVIKDSFFRGLYFNELPITVQAIANEGYEFVGWEGTAATGATIKLMPANLERGIKATFRKKTK